MGEIKEDSNTIVESEGTIMQQFIPVNDYLRNVSFYIYNEDVEGLQDTRVFFRLYDANLNKIDRQVIYLDQIELPCLITIPLRGEWKTGEVYYFSIHGREADLLLSMEDGINMDVQYGYRVFLTPKQYLMIGF